MPAIASQGGTTPFAVALEIIRHRLQTACDNAAISIGRVSGSPIAVEANDLNTVVTDATGSVVACGRYTVLQVGALQHLIRYVLDHYEDDPGIGEGDMFLSNDPYVGTIHQPDVGLVAPLFVGGRIVAWVGSVVHQLDIGGPHPGGLNPNAVDIFTEACPIPPLRIVEAGRIRPDIEAMYLRRSRVPGMLALDLRGQIAANRTAGADLHGLCAEEGTETFLAAVDQLLRTAESQLRDRLRRLPDGRWREVCYMDVERHGAQDDEPDAVRLVMTKVGDELILDFTESSAQISTPANLTRVSLESMVMAATLPLLAYRLPWVMGGLSRAIAVKSRPGTIVDCEWPGATGHGPTSTGQAVRACMTTCIGRLLDSDEETARDLMAGCMTAGAGHAALSGHHAGGEPFEAMLMDGTAGGMGARGAADGLDNAGVITSMGMLVVNAELAEASYPVRYLDRHERVDSGGLGEYRGGVGAVYRLTVTSPDVTCTGLEFAATTGGAFGLSGGGPGMLGATLVERAGDEPTGVRRDLHLEPGANLVEAPGGGGGIGDPLDRDPRAVAGDVAEGLVSRRAAREDYGVVLADGDARRVDDEPRVDDEATRRQRLQHRRARLGGRDPRPPLATPVGERVSGTLGLVHESTRTLIACRRCGWNLGDPTANVKDALVLDERPVSEVFPDVRRYQPQHPFVIRVFYCPGCAQRIDVEVNRPGSPFVHSVELGPRLAPLIPRPTA
jgi:N-methylhydantoinase B